VADDDAGHDEPIELTNADWGKIHAMAWREQTVRVRDERGEWVETNFRSLLETNPTFAVKYYASEVLLLRADQVERLKIVKLRPKPCDVPEEFWEDVNPFPPSCC
jgi:hypothetical protein